MDNWLHPFATVQQWLYETAVQPLAFGIGLGNLLTEAFEATGWFVAGCLQILVIAVVIGSLQRWRPVEPIKDKATVRTDVIYTLIHRLGLFRLFLFFAVTPWIDELFGYLRVSGLRAFHLDDLWPGVTDRVGVSLVLSLLVFDFLGYWVHRAQHRFEWWWRLHALHHSQRQMTMWSDNRNHLLDDLLRDLIVVLVARLIGTTSDQFITIVAIAQLSESFQHANIRLWFGRVGERLWVSPRFHRRHHSIGIGHESHGKDSLGGTNFGILVPWWDVLFGTANFEQRYDPTGVRDQVEQGRDYGSGFWSQQWLGIRRLLGKA
jgi:sterol desaturase/sphingolipid hydroxylase (fatty acid hydroxylase superfamily)